MGQKIEDVIPDPWYAMVRVGSTPLDSVSSIFTSHLFVASTGDSECLLRIDTTLFIIT